jgi:hypothetical protein
VAKRSDHDAKPAGTGSLVTMGCDGNALGASGGSVPGAAPAVAVMAATAEAAMASAARHLHAVVVRARTRGNSMSLPFGGGTVVYDGPLERCPVSTTTTAPRFLDANLL